MGGHNSGFGKTPDFESLVTSHSPTIWFRLTFRPISAYKPHLTHGGISTNNTPSTLRQSFTIAFTDQEIYSFIKERHQRSTPHDLECSGHLTPALCNCCIWVKVANMHDLRRQALESGKTVSKKARSKTTSLSTSRTNSRANSRNPSRNASDDEGEGNLSDSTNWRFVKRADTRRVTLLTRSQYQLYWWYAFCRRAWRCNGSMETRFGWQDRGNHRSEEKQ